VRLLAISIMAIIVLMPSTSIAGEAKDLVGRINSNFGRVASAELEGWFTKTLVVNWKRETVKIQAGLITNKISSMRID
jgi:hypothetical protein